MMGRAARLGFLLATALLTTASVAPAAPVLTGAGATHGVIVQNVHIEDGHASLDRVSRLLETGVLKPRVAIALRLAEGALAQRLVENGAVKRGRLILTMN